jgi:hypothetical protein
MRLTEIKLENYIGKVLEVEGAGDGKYGNVIEKWVVKNVLGLDSYNTGEGPDISNGEHSIEIKSQSTHTKSNITIANLSPSDLESYDNWSELKKKKVHSDFIFVTYDTYDDVIEIVDMIVILRSEFADIFERKIRAALDRPGKTIDGVIIENGNRLKLRITQDRMRKDIIRKSSKAKHSTIDTLFEV